MISQRLDQVTVVTNTHEKRLDEMVVHQDALIAKVERLNEMEAMDREEEERYERCRKEIAEKYVSEMEANHERRRITKLILKNPNRVTKIKPSNLKN